MKTETLFIVALLLLGGCAAIDDRGPYDECPGALYDISDMNEPLSDEALSFVRFCRPRLETFDEEQMWRLASGGPFRQEDDPAHRITVSSYSLVQLPAEAFLYPGRTDCRHVTFWISQKNEYFVLISGGCLAYTDQLYGPFIREDRWKRKTP